MNPFTKIWHGLQWVFRRARPGLEEFLHNYLDDAIAIAKTVAQNKFGLTLDDLHNQSGMIAKIEGSVKQAIWDSINAAGKHPGNWVSILTAYALEALKRRD